MKASDLPDALWTIEWMPEGDPSEFVLWTESPELGTLFLFVDGDCENVMEREASAVVHVTVTEKMGSSQLLAVTLFDDLGTDEVNFWDPVGSMPF